MQRRTRSAARQSVVTEVIETAEAATEAVKKTIARTVKWDDLPEWQRDNHYIISGYVSETSSFRKCLHSLSYVHNETGNIYTHLVPSLVALTGTLLFLDAIAPRYETTTWRDHLALATFGLGCVTCLGMSGTYHTLKSHSQSVAHFGNKLDYLGIVILIETSIASVIYFGLITEPKTRLLFWGLSSALGVMCGVVSLAQRFRTPELRPFRASMFVAYGLSSVLPIIAGIRIFGLEECSKRIQVYWMVWEGILYISGSVIYAMRVPERFKPGTFDLWGHSHQIFHVLVVAAAICHGIGLLNAYKYAHEVVIPQMTAYA